MGPLQYAAPMRLPFRLVAILLLLAMSVMVRWPIYLMYAGALHVFHLGRLPDRRRRSALVLPSPSLTLRAFDRGSGIDLWIVVCCQRSSAWRGGNSNFRLSPSQFFITAASVASRSPAFQSSKHCSRNYCTRWRYVICSRRTAFFARGFPVAPLIVEHDSGVSVLDHTRPVAP